MHHLVDLSVARSDVHLGHRPSDVSRVFLALLYWSNKHLFGWWQDNVIITASNVKLDEEGKERVVGAGAAHVEGDHRRVSHAVLPRGDLTRGNTLAFCDDWRPI